MRFLIAFTLAFAIAYAVDIKSDTRDLIKCESKPGDLTLVDGEISDEGHTVGAVDILFKYPSPGNPQRKVINCIMLKDLKADQGSKVEIVGGGLGFTNVTIHFTSDFRKSIDYGVVIMGQ